MYDKKGTSMREAADNATFQVVSRGSMVLLAAVITLIILPFSAWFGSRVMSSMDQIQAKQDSVRDDIARINGRLVQFDTITGSLRERIEESNRIFNSRIDAVSNWSQRNADALDRLKDRVYPGLSPSK